MTKILVCLMGLPGAGKTTSARKLIDKYSKEIPITLCTFGARLRSKNKCLQSGDLSSINDVVEILEELLQEDAKVFLLDGFPRSAEQVEETKKIAINSKYKIIPINISDHNQESVKNRLKSRYTCSKCDHIFNLGQFHMCPKCDSKEIHQRLDDTNEDVVNRRIEIYLEQQNLIKNKFAPEFKVIDISFKDLDEMHLKLEQAITSRLREILK